MSLQKSLLLPEEDSSNIPDEEYTNKNRQISITDPGGSKTVKAETSVRNWLWMSIAFSAVHGTVTACLAYATASLGADLGAYGSGTLYFFYSIVALFFSQPVVDKVGPKNGIAIGCIGYQVYVAGFLVAVLTPSDVAWPVFLISCAIGGAAGGVLWTGQGKYFAVSTQVHSSLTGDAVSECTTKFSSIFATTYLALECVTKALASLIFWAFPNSGGPIVFSTYTVLSVLSCFLVLKIDNLGFKTEANLHMSDLLSFEKATKAIKLLRNSPQMKWLIPFQVSFALSAALLAYYIFGTIVNNSDELGEGTIGVLSAIILVTGTASTYPLSFLPRSLAISLGGICFSMLGGVLFFGDDEQLGTWVIMIIVMSLQGIGRSVWESTNKSVVADLYGPQNESASAFAVISFSNGIANALAFFTYEDYRRSTMGILVIVAGVISIPTYLQGVGTFGSFAKDTTVEERESLI